MAALKRLGWAKNLMVARARLGDPDAGEAFKAKKTVEGYRTRLLGTRAGGLADIDYFTPMATLDDLSDYLDTLEGASEPEQAMGLIHVHFLNQALRRNSVPTSGLPEAQADLLAKMRAMNLSPDQCQQVIYREIDTRGSAEVKTMADRVADAAARQEARLAEINRLVDEGNAQDKAARAPYEAAVPLLRDAERRMLANPNDADAVLAWKEAQAARDAAWDAYKAAMKDAREAFSRAREALGEDPRAAIANEVLGDLLERSPISQKDAEAWAGAVEIDRSLKNKLARNEYPPEQFRADIAEFYRLVRGKVSKIEFNAQRGNRASAEGIGSLSYGSINVTDGFNKRTLFHEMAHHIETDPAAKHASAQFLLTRRTSDKAKSLRKLTGSSGYRSDEVAFEDHFLNPYVGKYYSDGATEVFSMGIEVFSSPEKFADALARDPHHVGLMLGYLDLPSSPAFEAVKTMIKGKLQASEEFASQAEDEEKRYLDIIDRRVMLQKVPEPDYLAGKDIWLKRAKSLGKYHGKIFGWYVYDSKAYTPYSNSRRGPCMRLVQGDSDFSPSNFTVHVVAKRGIPYAKALAAHLQSTILSEGYTQPMSIDFIKSVAESLERTNA